MNNRDSELEALAREATAVTLDSLELARRVRDLTSAGVRVDPSMRALVGSLNQRSAAALGRVTDRKIARQTGRAEDALVASMEYLDAKKFARDVRRRRALSDMRARLAAARERMVTPPVPAGRPLVASISDDHIDNPKPSPTRPLGLQVAGVPRGELQRRSRALAAKQRRQCGERGCDFVGTVMHVGKHQKETGHRGVISLPPVVLNKRKPTPWLQPQEEKTKP